MPIKTLLAALVLATTPGLASAMCNWGKQDTAQSCAQGAVWDAEAQRCVPQTTS